MKPSRASRLAAALSLPLLLAACQFTVAPPPEPDLTVTAQRITNDPQTVGSITVPGGATRWVEVQYRAVTTSPALQFFEIQGSGVEGDVRLEFRSERNRLLVASQSSRRFASAVSRLGAETLAGLDGPLDSAGRSAVGVAWECLGPCVARPYESGTYFVKLENTGGSARSVRLYAFGIEPTDLNEPNDTPAQATRVELSRAGDGAAGAIEHVDDVDYFRMTCSGDFVDAMRLELVSDFDRAIVLRANDRDHVAGFETDPVECGSVVSVLTTDGTGGPSLHSRYSILAEPAALFELDAQAQGSISAAPISLGSVSVPGNRARFVRLSFPSAPGADLRYVEIAGSNLEPHVRLEVMDGGAVVGYSNRRDLFASSVSALALDAGLELSAQTVDQSAIGLVWNCEGPCVATAYRPGEVIARIVNTSSTARTVSVYGYGTAEGDLNEPNDRMQDATEVLIPQAGGFVIGAIERLDDVDYFRLTCGAGVADLRLTLDSDFRGDIVMRVPGGQSVLPGTARVVDCDSVVSVYTRDGTAGPSAASRYRIDVD